MPAGYFKGFMAFGSALFAAVPLMVRESIEVLTLFIILDTITGVCLAARRRSVSSHTLRQKLAAKLNQYALIIGLGGGVALLAHQWTILGAGIGACLGIEAASIIETLLQWEKEGGAPLGPARPFFLMIDKYFAEPLAVVQVRETATHETTRDTKRDRNDTRADCSRRSRHQSHRGEGGRGEAR